MSQIVDCPECHGDGVVPVNPSYPDPQGAFDAPCVDCGGSGVKIVRAERRELARV